MTCFRPLFWSLGLFFLCTTSVVAMPEGEWDGGDWGKIVLVEREEDNLYQGTYTGTFNGQPGTLQFEEFHPPDTWKGSWTETSPTEGHALRQGTFVVNVKRERYYNRTEFFLEVDWKATDKEKSRPSRGTSLWARPKKP